MGTKKFLFVLFVGLILLVSACAPAVQPAQEATRTLNVTGSARTNAEPDIAYVSIGAHSESPEAAEAVAENNRQVQAIMDALIAMGVEEKDMQTSGFNIFPQDEWGPNGERTGTRFVVDNTVYVTLRDLDAIGELLGTAIDAGANSIYGIQFDIEDKSALITEARKQAVENAQTQAEELANAAGVTLGPIQSLSYYSAYPAPVFDSKVAYGGGALQEAVSSVPVSPGQLTITVEVNVSFEIR